MALKPKTKKTVKRLRHPTESPILMSVHLGRRHKMHMVKGKAKDGTVAALRLTDEGSRSSIEFEIPLEAFGRLLLNETIDGIPVSFHRVENLGLKRQIKTKKIYGRKYPDYKNRDEWALKLGRKYETEDWKFCGPQGSWSQGDTGYDHEKKKHWVLIHYQRFVPKD